MVKNYISKEMQEQILKTRRASHFTGGKIHHGFKRILRKGFALSDKRGYCKMCNWVWFENTGEIINPKTQVLIYINKNKLDDRFENLKKLTKEQFKKYRYQQVSQTLKGHKVSAQTRYKLSQKNLGKTPSKETREKISKANKGKVRSIQAKENMSKAQQLLIRRGKRKSMFGKKNPAWRGGIMFRKSTGYYYLHKPGHPTSDQDGYIKRANWIWFKNTGEYIKMPYFLHHKDEDKTNDKFENLQKTTRKEHMKFHKN